MPVNEAFCDDIICTVNDVCEKHNQIQRVVQDEKATRDAGIYDVHEALELTGNGWYNHSLCVVLGMALSSMVIELFGFSVIVAGASCDFHLTTGQQSLMTAVPFIGACVMCYPWGYLSDTQGRRKTLLVSLIISSLLSVAGSLSPDWITLSIIKFLSASSCSCAQSSTFALMGESSNKKYGKLFVCFINCFSIMAGPIYIAIAYAILNLNIHLDAYIVGTFTSWRLLSIVLAVPLVLSVFMLMVCYESPQYLAEQGREQEALNVLKHIFRRNGGNVNSFPVKVLSKVASNHMLQKKSFVKSVLDHAVPLFRPPLLKYTLQTYYLVALNYCISNSFFMLIPFVLNIYFEGIDTVGGDSTSICRLLNYRNNDTLNISTLHAPCIERINLNTMISAVASGVLFTILNLVISFAASRKKLVLLLIYLVSCTSSLAINTFTSPVATIVAYCFIMTINMAFGIINVYFIQLFPTSHRGMVMSLSVLVARLSSISGVSLLGHYIYTDCVVTFYVCGGFIFSGILVAAFLPGDKLTEANTG